ncbi:MULTISPECIES: hypothetical protein [unclassified Streptomyces]|uniref:Casein kinase substrate phosphoprotein PP28 domain-containing protein n=1 Tax=Streptomyces sp. NBC_00060 TaxID=2975636 RepID=A0AAU2HB52_9ACTN
MGKKKMHAPSADGSTKVKAVGSAHEGQPKQSRESIKRELASAEDMKNMSMDERPAHRSSKVKVGNAVDEGQLRRRRKQAKEQLASVEDMKNKRMDEH